MQNLVLRSQNSRSILLDLADVHYKLYRFDNQDEFALKRAREYYHAYVRAAHGDDANKSLGRSYPEVDDRSLLKKLAIPTYRVNASKVLYWNDLLFFGGSMCGSDDTDEKIYVYDRNDYLLKHELNIIKCDDEQQDGVFSLSVKDGKLYVSTAYRYEDKDRPNLFIYDLNTWRQIGLSHEETENADASIYEHDLSYADDKTIRKLFPYAPYKGILKGWHKVNNGKYLITRGREDELTFQVYNRLTSDKIENIKLQKRGASFYLFDENDKIVIKYFTMSKTLIEIYDVKTGGRRHILSMDNDSRGLGVGTPKLMTYKNYLIISHRQRILFYDVEKMALVDVISNIFPDYQPKQDERAHEVRDLIIDNDKRRLLVFTTFNSGQGNFYIDLDILDRSRPQGYTF